MKLFLAPRPNQTDQLGDVLSLRIDEQNQLHISLFRLPLQPNFALNELSNGIHENQIEP